MKKQSKERLVTVATGENGETLEVALTPNDPNHDGYIMNKYAKRPVFVYTAYMQYAYGESDIKWKMILDTEFHRQFWDTQDDENAMSPKDWTSTFITRELPFSEEALKSVGFMSEEIYGRSQRTED